jgi:hypothetical protein
VDRPRTLAGNASLMASAGNGRLEGLKQNLCIEVARSLDFCCGTLMRLQEDEDLVCLLRRKIWWSILGNK